MSVEYADDVVTLFMQPTHVYKTNDGFNLVGQSGDMSIGEYVHMYFKMENMNYDANTKIVKANFSAIGSVMLIAAAEKFCRRAEGFTFTDLLSYCDVSTGLQHELNTPDNRLHSVNFVINAFYSAFESLVNK